MAANVSGEARGARRTGPALEAMYRFTLWLLPTVEKFPRSQRFLIGDRIQSTALGVVENLIEATYTRQRDPLLQRANLKLEKLRYLFRLATDLKLLYLRRYEHAAGAGRDRPADRGLEEDACRHQG